MSRRKRPARNAALPSPPEPDTLWPGRLHPAQRQSRPSVPLRALRCPQQYANRTKADVEGHRDDPLLQGELLLPRHPAQAAGRPQLHAHPDQRPEVPGRGLPAGRPHGHAQPQGAGQLRAELVGRRPARGPGRRASAPTRPGRVARGPRPLRDVRRPLQPGPAVLHQPGRDRADAHRQRPDVRAEQGRDPGDPGADGRRTC